MISCPTPSHYVDRGRSTQDKKVGRVRSFKLRAKSEFCSGIAAWHHSGGVLRNITPEENTKVTVQSSTAEIHSEEVIQSESFVAHETWGTR